ncbi:MAG: LPXTG cell wall anchor domain-containing protein [Candidatus Melainabacteria bacterium]|nr:LPXTG cell wall anchor domain-containing protein [Candidatus Melainabacteria bacterium]
MRSNYQVAVVTLALVCGLGLPAFGQSESKAPGPGENLPVSAGDSELTHVTPEYMGIKRFWSDDAPIALATLGILAAACGAGYMILKKKKK